MKKLFTLTFLLVIGAAVFAQITTPAADLVPGFGIGIYGSGTETGFGYRSSKNTRLAADIRVAKANIFTEPQTGSIVNEASLIYRIAYYEKARFFVGIGARVDWGIGQNAAGEAIDNKYGVVFPMGAEAFPFPFQNAGLFFEAGPFVTTADGENYNIGIRTVTGFAFYFLRPAKG